MIRFFLQRPIFASVCSAIILLAGAVVIPTLPIAQFPKIAPPVVTVTATWTGASAQAVEASVTRRGNQRRRGPALYHLDEHERRHQHDYLHV
jgi:HAE1 family hydrophobic/amphiphilic exporter-1